MGKVKVGIKILNEKRSKEKVGKDDRKELQSILPLAETTRIFAIPRDGEDNDPESIHLISSRDTRITILNQ